VVPINVTTLVVELFFFLCNKSFPLPHFSSFFILNSYGVDRKDNENDMGVQTTLNEPMCLTIVLFGVLLQKKHVFIERNFKTKYFEFIYLFNL
jgi:hypothetical protein